MAKPISFQGQLWNREPFSQSIRLAAYKTQAYGLPLVKSKTPVRSGDMQAAWEGVLRGDGILWLNKVPYSGFVEYGTSKMAPRYPLTNSLPAIEDFFSTSLAGYIEIYK